MRDDGRAATEAGEAGGDGGPSWAALAAFGAASRLAVVVLGCLLARAPMPASTDEHDRYVGPANRGYNQRHHAALAGGSRAWIRPWYRYDAIWYAEIARRGYSFEPPGETSAAFLPLLPLVMAAGGAAGLDPYWVGLVVPNLAFVVGLMFFGRAAWRATGDARTAWGAVVLLTAFPTSMYFSAPYQESLALALTAGSILAWLDRRPILAAVALAPASAARLSAVSVSAAVVAEWFADVLRRRPARHAAWLVAAAGGVGVGLFFLYLGYRFGEPTAHLKAHAAWGRTSTGLGGLVTLTGYLTGLVRRSPGFVLLAALAVVLPWGDRAARALLPPGPRGWRRRAASLLAGAVALAAVGLVPRLREVPAYLLVILESQADALVMLLFLSLGVHAWVRRGAFWGVLVLAPVGMGMASGTTVSLKRIVLASFAGFIDASECLGRRAAFWLVVALSTFAQIVLIDRFVNFRGLG